MSLDQCWSNVFSRANKQGHKVVNIEVWPYAVVECRNLVDQIQAWRLSRGIHCVHIDANHSLVGHTTPIKFSQEEKNL